MYSKALKIINNKNIYIKSANSNLMINEIEKCFLTIEKFCRVYETLFLFASFSEELKLFISRTFTNPKIKRLKSYFVYNYFDNEEKLKKDLKIFINNFIAISEALDDYPEWKNKFILDISKQFAFINIQKDAPDVYKLIQQQKLFK